MSSVSFQFPSPTITFEAALRDLARGKPKSRARAAQALGDVTEPTEKRRAVDALIAALDDDHPAVRMEACAALGTLGEPGALPQLIKRLDDSAAPVRQNAAIALGTIGHPDGFGPLAAVLVEGPPDLRFQAATSLAEIEPIRAFDFVLAALDDRDPQVVAAAALSVGAIAKLDQALAPRALSALRAKIEHPDASTRFDIAYSLAELGDETGRGVLAKAAADTERAWDAISALGEIRATEELSRAIAAKKTPAEARVLAAGRLLAAGGGDDSTRALLLDALTDRKIHVRGIALEQLTAVGGPWAKAPLEKLARSGKGADLLEAITAALQAIEGRS